MREGRKVNFVSYLVGGLLAFAMLMVTILIVVGLFFTENHSTTITFIYPDENQTTYTAIFYNSKDITFPSGDRVEIKGKEFAYWYWIIEGEEVEVNTTEIFVGVAEHEYITLYAKYITITDAEETEIQTLPSSVFFILRLK